MPQLFQEFGYCFTIYFEINRKFVQTKLKNFKNKKGNNFGNSKYLSHISVDY